MSTFDSTKVSLKDLLSQIEAQKIQLPDFQRGWVWDDDHIKDLLVSLAESFPIGAVMLLETGGEIRFQTRPVEGIIADSNKNGIEPDRLILDGQQRLTTLTQVLKLEKPVDTRTNKGKKIQRYYFFDILAVIEQEAPLLDCIVATDESCLVKSNFGRNIDLDLSTVELQCKTMHFPCNKILNSDDWEMKLSSLRPDQLTKFMQFRARIIHRFREYHLPVIELKRETSKEAVCLVFEKVNTGGVQLSVFELITASFAAEGFNLRDDWFGSIIRKVDSRKKRLEQHPLIKKVDAPEFLQAITMLHTLHLRAEDLKEGKSGKKLRPISAKRADILNLPLSAWKKYADQVEAGFKLASKFLEKESFFSPRDIPYSTQIVPLATVLSVIKDRWLEPKIFDKLSRWFWCGVLGELYGGAVETRMALDVEQLLGWFEHDDKEPKTVIDASFQVERLDTLRSRLSAAYKGISALMVRQGAKDWFWKETISGLDKQDIALDIHHVFPKRWCEQKGLSPSIYDSILNKTPLSYKANRKIGGSAPSEYLLKLQSEKTVDLSNDQMNSLVNSHVAEAKYLRDDDFEGFIADRKVKLKALIDTQIGIKHHPDL